MNEQIGEQATDDVAIRRGGQGKYHVKSRAFYQGWDVLQQEGLEKTSSRAEMARRGHW
jgi:hypothetical protein